MGLVHEDVTVMRSPEPLRTVVRDEELLLGPPHPSAMPIKLWRDQSPLPIVHFPQDYQARPFAPPRGVYENTQIRIEWQTMDNRQPFYHRNCDVDEISYQIAGERTLMTELGVVEHREGEFSRIPRGVSHDNYGRCESHLLFYIPATVDELVDGVRSSQAVSPPFPGWAPGKVNEAVTECMGTVGHDIAVFAADEEQLLDQVTRENERLQVLQGVPDAGITWLYSASPARLGIYRTSKPDDGRRYRRLLDADEIQYQISGRRVLLTQRGVTELGPGDFIRIPMGVAHASISTEPVDYLVVQADRELLQMAEPTRTARQYSAQWVAEQRGEDRGE
jgi:quercetin dioxygenase-like cupin family protein